jgi:acetyl/propionyl-CoA carboxylase alpha subunit/acetyl-CoA carboxylase carboxyltransferase component
MTPDSLLIANRGEIAVRIARAAATLGIPTVTIHSEDDAASLHTRQADRAIALRGAGPRAYLDMAQVIQAAREAACDAVHPGYGFLAESSELAARCSDAGLRFVGPTPDQLALFGDKVRARELASRCQVPVLPGTGGVSSLEEMRDFMQRIDAPLMIKAIAGGGGRGMRAVRSVEELESAFERCESEARAAFGNGDLYAERWVERARHLEIQIVGDGTDVVALGDRECSLQRRHQKLVEVAPSPGLSDEMRSRMTDAACKMARSTEFSSLGTFEFLVDAEDDESFYFIEANPRLQVEHTVTEQVTGVDLVAVQLQLSAGRTLAELGIVDAPPARGFAIQARVNMETLAPDGSPRPASGTLRTFEVPNGPGLRTDTFGYAGYTVSPNFDSLLAKVIGHSPSPNFEDAVSRTWRALCEFRIEGVATNLPLLRAILRHPDFAANRVHTRFVEERIAELVESGDDRSLFFESAAPAGRGLAGAQIDTQDPLAVLTHGKSVSRGPAASESGTPLPEGSIGVAAPLQGTLVSIEVQQGQPVRAGQALLVMEAMKMEHVIESPVAGIVAGVTVAVGDAVVEGHELVFVEESEVELDEEAAGEAVDLDHIRPDLAEVRERHAVGLDPARPDAVARRRKTGQRTTRENVADLCDPDSFVEYGPLVVAAQRRRRSMQELIERTPADGMVGGVGTVNAALFEDAADARCVVVSYDYTVLAGTQGAQNHRKKDRLFELAENLKLPLVFFTEGGGGRPGDTDGLGSIGLECLAFWYFGRLSGLVPLVGINSGRCFAGNAALLGCCDVVIATENSNIGMGGPAMIEGGGLGVFRPEEVGPIDVQRSNGVVDIVVADEAEAVEVARQYLLYFQGPVSEWECPDQRLLRGIIPENRLRIYDVREVVRRLADTGSVLELRRDFGLGMLTALVRIEGRPVGVVANNPTHLAGAIDSDAADKATRFMQLCDAFDIPILFLCDTPGIMVGPEVEKTALVRHAARMFVTGASVTVPFFTIVLRKSYGLGAQAMAGGSFRAPVFTVSWPTGEFGGMGLEGAVKLGYRNELAAIEDPVERRALYERMVDKMYEVGKAVNVASTFEIDDVIDPADSRHWIVNALRASPPPAPRSGKKRSNIDTW